MRVLLLQRVFDCVVSPRGLSSVVDCRLQSVERKVIKYSKCGFHHKSSMFFVSTYSCVHLTNAFGFVDSVRFSGGGGGAGGLDAMAKSGVHLRGTGAWAEGHPATSIARQGRGWWTARGFGCLWWVVSGFDNVYYVWYFGAHTHIYI